MHVLEPAADHELAGQLLHAVEPAMGLYVFAGQLVQAAELKYDPGEQFVTRIRTKPEPPAPGA